MATQKQALHFIEAGVHSLRWVWVWGLFVICGRCAVSHPQASALHNVAMYALKMAYRSLRMVYPTRATPASPSYVARLL